VADVKVDSFITPDPPNPFQTLATRRGKSGLKTTTIPSNTVKDEELVSSLFKIKI
jgi:hypothetical protein